ncbi:hypothetical protein [uncultured Fibrella sp.]|uniref:hypothetical protein n=1 Tax=uncultured Fibrella sp. TaxID=1284596 RepID=UPI0035CA8E05
MKQFIHSVSLALAGAALLTACSRPVATFQKSQPERFYSQQKTTEPVVLTEEVVTPAADVPAVVATEAVANAPVAVQTKQASDALASLKTTNSTDRRLTKRIEKAEKMLADVNQKTSTQAVTSTKKASFFERTMLKSIDKKIKKHMAPKETTAMTGYVRLGAIIALVGLLLLLIGNGVGATIGLIALIAGLVLVLLGVINQGSL